MRRSARRALKVSVRGHAVERDEPLRFVSQKLPDLVCAPKGKRSLLTLRIRVRRRKESTLGRRHLAQDVVERRAEHAREIAPLRDLPRFGVGEREQRVVVRASFRNAGRANVHQSSNDGNRRSADRASRPRSSYRACVRPSAARLGHRCGDAAVTAIAPEGWTEISAHRADAAVYGIVERRRCGRRHARKIRHAEPNPPDRARRISQRRRRRSR